MTFSQYIEIIKESVATEGYDRFFPSLCHGESDVNLNVLECELGDAGEEVIAKEWATRFLDTRACVYLAYRCGDRFVDVCEIRGLEVTEKVRINVIGGRRLTFPHSEWWRRAPVPIPADRGGRRGLWFNP